MNNPYGNISYPPSKKNNPVESATGCTVLTDQHESVLYKFQILGLVFFIQFQNI